MKQASNSHKGETQTTTSQRKTDWNKIFIIIIIIIVNLFKTTYAEFRAFIQAYIDIPKDWEEIDKLRDLNFNVQNAYD